MQEDKVKLKIVGISYSQIQSGAYALILAEEIGQYHIPIVIGASEAQSIAISLERINMPRPLTHDLIINISTAFGIKLKEVFINKFEDGIFYSELTIEDDSRQIIMDSRTSDAIAIAIRTKAPIFTTRKIIEDAGFIMESIGENKFSLGKKFNNPNKQSNLENLSLEELNLRLQAHIELEEYEEAAVISKIIKTKEKEL